MRLDGERESDNVEDRRGDPAGGGSGGGGGFALGGRSIGGLGVLAIIIAGAVFGFDPSQLLQLVSGGSTGSVSTGSGSTGSVSTGSQTDPRLDAPGSARSEQQASAGGEDEQKRFVATVLAETEDTWGAIFQQMGRTYQRPRLVLYAGETRSACGSAEAAVGPFYCPGDQKVYLDTAFFRDLQTKFGAPGEFARAYVIAHEIGHHVQNQLGITERVDQARQTGDKAAINAASVRLELQADCFAGMWANQANRARHILEPGDIDAGLTAASAVGDDRLQMQARGYVVPESFTHGSSAQRSAWFKRGYAGGALKDCDTFGSDRL